MQVSGYVHERRNIVGALYRISKTYRASHIIRQCDINTVRYQGQENTSQTCSHRGFTEMADVRRSLSSVHIPSQIERCCRWQPERKHLISYPSEEMIDVLRHRILTAEEIRRNRSHDRVACSETPRIGRPEARDADLGTREVCASRRATRSDASARVALDRQKHRQPFHLTVSYNIPIHTQSHTYAAIYIRGGLDIAVAIHTFSALFWTTLLPAHPPRAILATALASPAHTDFFLSSWLNANESAAPLLTTYRQATSRNRSRLLLWSARLTMV